ncbi:MAG: hypothetical protein LC778_05085 [Acidobacteria bacterium]|nr:hypothetical protein [Acidobacteriota bacterium]
MKQTAIQTATNFYPVPPINAAVRQSIKSVDAETRHRIYDRLLMLLSNSQIKAKNTEAVLPYILHPKTKETLRSEHDYSAADIAQLEGQIINDAEYLSDYEVIVRAPAALYYEYKRTGETDLVFDSRIVPLPNTVLNALICEELQKEFARKTLLRCDGFVEVRAADERGIVHKSIRLDVSGWIIKNGFMLPIYCGGLITALRIFRHPRDERPFRLKSRPGGVYL